MPSCPAPASPAPTEVEALFHANLRLAYAAAARFRRRWPALHSLGEGEVEQLCLLALWRSCRAHNPDRGTLGTLVFAACRRALATALRRSRGGVPALSLDLPGPDGSTLAEEVAAPAEPEAPDTTGLAAALAQLPPRMAADVVAHFGIDGRGGRTLRALAAERGVTYQAVGARVAGAVQRLRKALA